MNTEKTEAKKCYEIVAGPSKDTLFDACKYAYSKTSKVTVDFAVPVAYTMPPDHPGCAYIPMNIRGIRICGIEHEDGSGESFNLHGYCRADLTSTSEDATYTFYVFNAYYNSKTRKGTIVFIEQ